MKQRGTTLSWDSPNYTFDPDPDLWGEHRVTLDENPAELAGSGPWDGTVIVARRPDMYTSLWLHSDFLKDLGVSYGKVDKINTDVYPCVRGLGSSANVYEMNEACGLLGALSSFHDKVKAHEREHLESLNSCLKSETAKGRQRALEAVVGEGADGSQALRAMWATFVQMIRDANEGQVTGDESSVMWNRAGRTEIGLWARSKVSTSSHGGTLGCSPPPLEAFSSNSLARGELDQ